MEQKDLTPSQLLGAKSLATEVALLALLREKRGDQAFWTGMDKLMQVVLSLESLQSHPSPVVRAQADAAQDFLDGWRQIAGTNPNDPAPPGSGPFDPPDT